MAKQAPDSISVTPTFQLLFAASFLTVWALMLMNVGLYLFKSAEYTDMTWWYVQVLISLLPGLMLAVAWWYVGSQKTVLSRFFLASLIAFMGFMLTSVMQQLAFLIPTGAGGRVSDTAQIVEPLVAFALYSAVIVWAKKVKG